MTLHKLDHRQQAVDSLLCIGLDPEVDRLSAEYRNDEYPLFAFNRALIEQTHHYTAAYKPNLAFYEGGNSGWQQLQMTADYLRTHHPDIFLIADAKRGDIGHTSERYASAVFDELGFDAITLNPYMGQEALQPFLSRADRVSIIVCRTSNPGAAEFQDTPMADSLTLWQQVAQRVATVWNSRQNCMLVVGATEPHLIQSARQLAPDVPFLIPGVGAQGGNLTDSVRNGLTPNGRGLLINVGRAVMYAEDSAATARAVRDQINLARQTP